MFDNGRMANKRNDDPRPNQWIADRLKQVGSTQVALAENLNVAPARIIEMIKAQREIQSDEIIPFAQVLNIDPSSVVDCFHHHRLPDTIEPFDPADPIEPTNENSLPADARKSEVLEVIGEDYAAIPRWDMRASAGPGQLVPDQPEAIHRILFRMQWLRSVSRAPLDKIFALEVEGDSMEPTLRKGDLVLVDQTRTNPGADAIFLLNNDGELQVKRVQIDPRTKMLTIRSDNPAYRDWDDVPPHEVDIIGRVFWIGRHF